MNPQFPLIITATGFNGIFLSQKLLQNDLETSMLGKIQKLTELDGISKAHLKEWKIKTVPGNTQINSESGAEFNVACLWFNLKKGIQVT